MPLASHVVVGVLIDITVATLVNEATLASGEKIAIRRFTRYELGEGIEKKVSDLASEIEAMTRQA